MPYPTILIAKLTITEKGVGLNRDTIRNSVIAANKERINKKLTPAVDFRLKFFIICGQVAGIIIAMAIQPKISTVIEKRHFVCAAHWVHESADPMLLR